MNTETKDFDALAASFDEVPRRVKLAKDVALAISKQIPLTHDMNVMDFGCGTGLLSIELQPFVHSIMGIDSSEGMLNEFRSKITRLRLNNTHAQLIDTDERQMPASNYDLVVSNMTLHHIKEIKPLFKRFYDIISPAGHLCISDLDLNVDWFDDDRTGVSHFGFNRANLRVIFAETGFCRIHDMTVAALEKLTDNGEVRRSTVFLMTGEKGLEGA